MAGLFVRILQWSAGLLLLALLIRWLFFPKADLRTCRKCAHVLDEGDRFCPNCGTEAK